MNENILCRTCGRGGLNFFVPLLHISDVFSETVLRMIKFGIGLEVNSNDGYPQHVCRTCYGQILVSYELKRASIESQTCFQQLFPQATDVTSDVELHLKEAETAQDFPMQEVKLKPVEITSSSNVHDESSTLDCNRIPGNTRQKRHNTKLKRKVYSCKYCPYTTYHRMNYLFHYKTHPMPLRCVCGLVTDRKFVLQRHLAKFDCEKLYGQKVNFTPTTRRQRRKNAHDIYDHAKPTDVSETVPVKVKFEAEELTIIDEIPKLEEVLRSDNAIENRLFLNENDTTSDLLIGAVKLETEDISMVEEISALNGECSMEEGTNNMESENQEEHRFNNEASLELKVYECKFCTYSTHDRKDYMCHYKIHPNAVNCVCGFWTERKYTLQRHLMSFGCEEIYGTKVNLGYVPRQKSDKNAKHIEDHQLVPKRQKVYICRICGQVSNDKQTREDHLKTHPKAPRCVCGFTTDLISILKLHMEYLQCEQIHGEKVNWEDFKEGQISNNDSFGEPLLPQTVKRRVYKCDYCSYIGDNRIDYMAHYKTHPTAFRCVCGFTTDRKYCLKRHQANRNCETVFGLKANSEKNREVDDDDTSLESQSNQKSSKTNDDLIEMGFAMRTTRNLSKFYCCKKECQEEYDSEETCAEHVAHAHKIELPENRDQDESDKINCKSCHQAFSDEKALSVHLDDIYQPLFRCNTCGKDDLTRQMALQHSLNACTIGRFSCSCGFLTNELSSLKDHIQFDICNDIQTAADTNQSISIENPDQNDETSPLAMRSQEQERCVCKNCGVVRRNKISLTNHLRIETRRAMQQQCLMDSGRTMKGIPGKVYKCRWCNEPTNNTKHLVKCMAEAKECATCRTRFPNTMLLSLHYRECKKIKINYQCPFCEVQFTNAIRLKSHINRDHKINRNHECNICNYFFGRKSSLVRHMLNQHKQT